MEINRILLSQYYRTSLGMLRQALEKIPEGQLNTTEYSNPNWQIIYHTIYATKLYLSPNPESYTPFEGVIQGAESLCGSQDWENAEIKIEGYHTKEELLSFLDAIESDLEQSISASALDSSSGFKWYPYSRLELHINNIRHIQHHTAQIIERLKAKQIKGFRWWIDENPPQKW